MNLDTFKPLINDFIMHFCSHKVLSIHTIKSYTCDLMHLAAFWEQYDVNAQWNDVWKRYYITYLDTLSPRSLSRKISTLKQFSLFCNTDHTHAFPFACRRKKIIKAASKGPSKEDLAKLNAFIESTDSNVLSLRNKAIFSLIHTTGMLSSEVANLKIHNINLLTRRFTIVPFNKAKKFKRLVPIVQSTADIISKYLSNERAKAFTDLEYLFINDYGQGLTTRSIQRICIMVGEKACLKNPLTPHELRQAYREKKRAEGTSEGTINLLLGIRHPTNILSVLDEA